MIGIICSPPKTGQKDTEVGMILVSFNRRTFNRVTQQMPSLVKCEGEAFCVLLDRKSVYLSKGYLYSTHAAERKKAVYRVITKKKKKSLMNSSEHSFRVSHVTGTVWSSRVVGSPQHRLCYMLHTLQPFLGYTNKNSELKQGF